jgi:hypothetical protein
MPSDNNIKRPPAALFRVVDLSGKVVSGKIGLAEVKASSPGDVAAPVQRVPAKPLSLDLILSGGKKLSQQIDLVADQATTAYLMPDLSLKLMTGDPSGVGQVAPSLRLVNLTKKTVSLVEPGKESVDSLTGSKEVPVSEGSVSVKVEGVGPQSFNAEAKRTYLGLVFDGPNGPTLHIFITNPEMKVEITGSSAAG